MKSILPRYIRNFVPALVLLLNGVSYASVHNTITYNGTTHYIAGDTILLDREDIFHCPVALKDPSEAFARINDNGKRAVLLVAPSVYWLDDPDDPAVRSDKDNIPYSVRLKCDTLSIIGLTDRPEDVVFAVNRGQTQGAVGNFTMFHFKGHSLTTQDLTFGNYCNVDLIYPRDPLMNRQKRKDAIVQAQIGICDGTDRLFAQNTRFISRLNLCPFVGARRSLYDKCYFECTDDALSGSAVYLDCDFRFFSSKPFYTTADTGAVFLNCDITCLGSGTQYFTKVPGMVTAIDTRFHSEKPIEIKWTRDESDIICAQENTSLNGLPIHIDDDRPSLGISLKDSPLRKAYKIDFDGNSCYNLPNLLNGDDGWDPKGLNVTIRNIETATDSKLTGLPIALRVDMELPSTLQDGETVTVKSIPLLWGGYPVGQPDEFTFVAENDLPQEKKIIIPVSTQDGLTAQRSLTIAPKLREAPKFKHKPKIKIDEATNDLFVDYDLAVKGEDDSRITWCRIVNEEDSTRVLAMKESNAQEGRFFRPKAGDLGYGVVAVVFPKSKDSKYGPMEISPIFYVSEISKEEAYPESNLTTDFSDISIVKRAPGIPGVWSFDVYKPLDTSHVDWEATEGAGWYYGKGFDASTGMGIVQSEKGARMSYVPARDVCQDMTASLVVEPAKSGGQGFGSATSQYMDICVKFDPVNLNGYALRIERTPDHDRAVRFSLIRYDKGETEAITEGIISDCFRTPCHINVDVTDGILHTSAYTDAPASERRCCSEVEDKVELSVPIEESANTGFAIQHTGSVGPSSTLIRSLSLIWQ